MPNHYKARNKRIIPRNGNGRFRKTAAADFGIGGVCPNCDHLLIRHYDGDERDSFPDPRKFRYRCFTCEPRTEAELAREAEIEAERQAQAGRGLVGMLEDAMKRIEEE